MSAPHITSYDDPRQLATFLKAQVKYRGRPSVVCMIRDGFDHDVTELRARTKRYNWLRLPAVTWHNFVVALGMPPILMRQFGSFDYRAPEFDADWEKAENFCVGLLQLLQREVGVAAFMAANFDYGLDEGVRRACAKLPIPFLTLNREIPLFQFQSNFTNDHYRGYVGRPLVDAVAVGGKLARDELVDWKILDSNQVHITGFPRLDSRVDFLHAPPPAERNTILLFTYRDPDYLAGNNFNEALAGFAAAAERHPHINFVVKCKHKNDGNDVRDLLRSTPSHRLQVSHEPATKFLGAARAVMGFNSLSIVESLVSNAEVLVPQWGDTRTSQENQIYWREDPLHRRNITFLDSREDLDNALDRIARGETSEPFDMSERIALVQNFVHFDPERRASEAVEDFVDHYVKRRRGLVQGG